MLSLSPHGQRGRCHFSILAGMLSRNDSGHVTESWHAHILPATTYFRYYHLIFIYIYISMSLSLINPEPI